MGFPYWFEPLFSFYIYLFILKEREREREHEQGEGQKERERESQAGSTLSTEPDMRLDLTYLEINDLS